MPARQHGNRRLLTLRDQFSLDARSLFRELLRLLGVDRRDDVGGGIKHAQAVLRIGLRQRYRRVDNILHKLLPVFFFGGDGGVVTAVAAPGFVAAFWLDRSGARGVGELVCAATAPVKASANTNWKTANFKIKGPQGWMVPSPTVHSKENQAPAASAKPRRTLAPRAQCSRSRRARVFPNRETSGNGLHGRLQPR